MEGLIPSGPFEHARQRATVRLVRWLRHQLATPLSGAALHLDLAAKRLADGTRGDPERALENVKMSQAEIEAASRLLEVLSEVATCGEETPGLFSLPEAVAAGAAPSAANHRGISVELPVRSPSPRLFGVRRAIEQAVMELTGRVVGQAADGQVVRWTSESVPGEDRLVLSWPGRPEGNSPESLLGNGIARWAVESHGGTVSARDEGGRCLIVAGFPRKTG